MGWFWPQSRPECTSTTEEVRAGVRDLLQDDPALQTFVSESCLKRYLAARGQDVGKATQALRKTLLWRKQYRPEAITFDDVAVNASGGRVEVLSELDKHKRPILLYRLRCPSKKGTTGEEYIRFWVHQLESASKMADDQGVGKAVAIFDMEGYSNPATNMPNFTTRVEAVRLAQAHYPERLGLAVIVHPPLLFWALWKSLQPFLDPITKTKIFFASDKDAAQAALSPHVDPAVLYETLGGLRPEPYDAARAAAHMRKLDAERHAELSAAALPFIPARESEASEASCHVLPVCNGSP